MIRLAHLSDPHLGPLPRARLTELASKRMLGWLNWRMNRRGRMLPTIVDDLIDDVLAANADQVAVTGDLVNIALEAELEPARLFLARLGPPERVALVPGNHDAYVPGALKRAGAVWGTYMTGDEGGTRFPYVRRRGPVALVGVSSARATGPFLATGHIGEGQAGRLRDLLIRLAQEGLARIVLIHHPPVIGATAWNARLVGASRFRKALCEAGAELVLHGHTHRGTLAYIVGPERPVPVVGVPSASATPGWDGEGAGWNLISVDGAPGAWRITLERRSLMPDRRVVSATIPLDCGEVRSGLGSATAALRRAVGHRRKAPPLR